MTVLYQDDFNRVETGGIGRSSDYTPDGDVSDASVNGSEAVVNPDGSTWWEWDGAPTQHGYYYFDFYVQANLSDPYAYYEIDTKVVAGRATYIYTGSYGNGTWYAGAYTNDGPNAEFDFVPSPSTWYTAACHLDAVGNMVRLKVWQRGTAEPGTWGAEEPHTGGQSAGWTPYVGLYGGIAEAGRFDNLIVSDVPYSPLPEGEHIFSLDAWIDSELIEDDFSVDALIKRTWLPPDEPTSPGITQVASLSNAVDDNATLTLTVDGAVVDGDLLVASVSYDCEGASDVLLQTPTGWFLSRSTTVGTNDQRLATYYRIWRTGDPMTADFVTLTGALVNWATAKAGGLTVFHAPIGFSERINPLEYRTQASSPTYLTTPHGFTLDQPLSSNPLYMEDLAFYGVIAGGGFGSRTWTYTPQSYAPSGVEELFQESASNWASAVGYFWHQLYSNAGWGIEAVPDAGEPFLSQMFIIHAPWPAFGLYARIDIGGTFSLNAYLHAAAFETTHARDGGLHYGLTPDTGIILSSPLGTLSAGATLHEALRELDDLISARERGE